MVSSTCDRRDPGDTKGVNEAVNAVQTVSNPIGLVVAVVNGEKYGISRQGGKCLGRVDGRESRFWLIASCFAQGPKPLPRITLIYTDQRSSIRTIIKFVNPSHLW